MQVAREPFFEKHCPSWEESNHRFELCQSTGGSDRLGVGLGGEYHFFYYLEVKKMSGGLFLLKRRIYTCKTCLLLKPVLPLKKCKRNLCYVNN